MKIKDLPADTNMGVVRFIHPETKQPVYWFSQWQKGIWYKTDLASKQFLPLFVDDLKDALDLEVAE